MMVPVGSADGLSGKSKVAGVMGWPVDHSLSPRLHGYWLQRYGIDGAYVPLAVAPTRVEQAIRGLSALGFAGANVTVPHKVAVLEFMDEVSSEAMRIGAVNTIMVRDDGSLYGTNTDGFGFMESIRAGSTWRPGMDAAVVLGAGGAARAVVAALVDVGVSEIRLANRSREKAEALAAHLGDPVQVVEWRDRSAALAKTGLLVNTTVLGMVHQPPLEIVLDDLPVNAVVVDIVYRPLVTPILQAAVDKGCQTVEGLGMLLHQARPAFNAWFGVDPEVTAELRGRIIDSLDEA